MRDINMEYAAVASLQTNRVEYKAIFEEQAKLLGFQDTGQTVQIKLSPEDEVPIMVPLYADPAA